MTALDDLTKRYRQLPKNEQRILYVMSVIYQPLNQTNLKKILDKLGWKDGRGYALSDKVTKPFKDKLLKRDLLANTGNNFNCNNAVMEYITRQGGDHLLFEEVAQAAEQILPSLAEYGRIRPPSAAAQIRRLRIALYLDQEQALFEQLEIEKPLKIADYDEVETLINLCVSPLDIDWLKQRPLSVQLQVLIPLITMDSIKLEDKLDLAILLEQGQSEGLFQHQEFSWAIAQYKLQRWQLEGLDSLLDNDTSSQGLALRGWQAFLLDDNETALTLYEQSLTVQRKGTRKRKVYIEGLSGIFYLLSLLKSANPEHLTQLKLQADMASSTPNENPQRHSAEIIASAAAGISPNTQHLQIMLFNKHLLANDKYSVLFYLLALKWQGEKPLQGYIDILSTTALEAHQNGFLWYAYEAALLIKSFTGRAKKTSKTDKACLKIAAEANKRKDLYTITQLIKAKEPWEKALQALQALNPTTGSGVTTPDNTASHRMAWRVNTDYNSFTLLPREQKRNKNGKWGKGRAVAVKRLHDTPEEFDYLSDEDKRICATIECEISYQYFGRYSTTEYYLPSNKALFAAVGHPHIYWDSNPEQRIEIAKAEPELHVQKRKSQLKITLAPLPDPGMSDYENQEQVCIEQNANNRLTVVKFSPQHLKIAKILGEKGLKVPLNAEQQVLESLAAIAPLLTVQSDIGGGEAIDATSVEASTQLHIHLQPAGEGFKLTCYARPFGEAGPLFVPGEGGSTVFAEISGQKLQTSRSLKDEKSSFKALTKRCPTLHSDMGNNGYSNNDWELQDPEQALTALQELQELGDEIVLEWPEGSNIKLSKPRDVDQMQLSVRKQQDWFALEGELNIGEDQVLSLEHLITLMQESPGRFIRLKDGEFLTLTETLQKRLEDIASFTTKGRFHPLASPVLEEITDGMSVKASKPWKDQLKRLKQAYSLQAKVPSTLQAELRDYQVEGYEWLARLAHWGAGACLADDMGLGKTVQSLALILDRAAQGPTLILAPTSVSFNWQEEACRFAPTLNVLRFGNGDRQKMLDNAGPFDLIICSYGLLQSEAERVQGVHWHTVVADEAQAIKNPQAKRSIAAMGLSADFKMIATGTPIENHLGELWNLFRFINPGLLGSREQFNERFANPIENDNDRNTRLQLKQFIQPFILRRLKSDVLSELPSRTEITIHVELSKEETAFYEALRRTALKNISEAADSSPGQQRVKVLAEIMRLRRACCSPQLVMPDCGISSAKLAAFGEILDELLENRHKALVFSQFVGHLALLREYLDARGIHYQYLDGSTPVKKRQAAVKAFQAGEGDLFLISLKAGGAGLNLTAADYVIHMDPWWNPAVEDQASDRAHRMGQKRPVTIYRLVAGNTIEDKIVQMHQKKRDLASNLLEGTELSGKISLEEIVGLIKEM